MFTTIDEITEKFNISFNSLYKAKEILNIFNCEEMDVNNYNLTNKITLHIIALYFEHMLQNIKLMLEYYSIAIELGNSDSMYNLGIYYNKQNDIINRDKYMLMAIYHNNYYARIYLMGYYDILIIYKMLLNIPNPNIMILNKINEFETMTRIQIYNKQINTATIIAECNICYENKLQLSFICGHMLCLDCYCNITSCYYKCYT